MRRLVWTLVGLVLLFVIRARAGTPRPVDWEEQLRPPAPQRQAPPMAANPLLAPSPAAPALVAWDEAFELTLALPAGMGAGAERASPSAWQVTLRTRSISPFGGLLGSPVLQRYRLPVESASPGPRPGLLTLGLRMPAAVPREVFHLEVQGPEGLVARRINAVRNLGDPLRWQGLRFAAIADSQLDDPSSRMRQGAFNNNSYPRRCSGEPQRMLLQQVEELDFFDPDFVLYLGDLFFGVDYRRELPRTLQLWWTRPLAAFMVPGNHDAMALYQLALKEGWWADALSSVRCARVLSEGEVDASRIFALLSCLHGDLKDILFTDLQQDGLDYWRRSLGATQASLDLGDAWTLITLNSYSGSAARRHGFVLGLGFAGLDLGVATVDNYGGNLSEAQLSWLKKELARAEGEGRHVLLALHHDPRGNADLPWGQRYHANLPFPTEPLGLRKFQEWNYENPEWDSDPADGRGAERQEDNSATRLLKMLDGRVRAVFSGHLHADRDSLVPAGGELVPGSGLRVKSPVRFCRVTSASATPLDERAYWGFRIMGLRPDGGLDSVRYQRDWKWASLPSGNLWFEGDGHRRDGGWLYRLHNGLPRPVEGRLRAYLPERLEGYRFEMQGPGQVQLEDMGRGAEGQAVYYLRVKMPGVASGRVPPPAGEEPTAELRVRPARGNRVPVADFRLSAEEVFVGQVLDLDASAARDPEGGALLSHVWDFGDGRSARGRKVQHSYKRPGTYELGLRVMDQRGAWAHHGTRIRVSRQTPSCAQGATGRRGPCSLWVAWVLGLGLALWGRRVRGR